MMNNAPTASSALEFLKKREQLVKLPSGLTALLRRPSLLSLVAHAPDGAIPPAFKSQLQQRFKGSASGKMPEVSLAEMEQVMRYIAAAAFVSPVVVPAGDVPDYERNEIAVDDIDPEDVQFIFMWVNGTGAREVAAIERFPQQSSAGVESASDV